jgi:hypothetical protein
VRANLEGRVVCLAAECAPVQVSLIADGVAASQKTTTGANGQFKFEGELSHHNDAWFIFILVKIKLPPYDPGGFDLVTLKFKSPRR